jgi:hypothetical protein
MKRKKVIWGFIILIIGGIIVGVLISSQTFSILKEKLRSLNLGVSPLEVIERPGEYLDKEITLKNVQLCVNNKIRAQRKDGTGIYLDYKYAQDINQWYRFDLTGTVLSPEQTGNCKTGCLVKVDGAGKPVPITYFFGVKEAVRKERLESGLSPLDCQLGE